MVKVRHAGLMTIISVVVFTLMESSSKGYHAKRVESSPSLSWSLITDSFIAAGVHQMAAIDQVPTIPICRRFAPSPDYGCNRMTHQLKLPTCRLRSLISTVIALVSRALSRENKSRLQPKCLSSNGFLLAGGPWLLGKLEAIFIIKH